MHVGVLERLLQFGHAITDHRTGPRARRVNEICDPDFAAQIAQTEILSVLIDQLKFWNTCIRGNRSLAKSVDFELLKPKQTSQGDDWNANERDFPEFAWSCRGLFHRCGARAHALLKTSAPSKSGK